MINNFDPGAEPGRKTYRDGTHRLISPKATLSRVTPLLPAMGITRIANVTGLDRIGVPVVMVIRPNARSIVVSQGKGLDLDAARASGVMEAIEIYHAEHVDLPLRLASHREMERAHELIDLDRLPTIAAGRYHPHLPMLWIEGWDLLGGKKIWLPYETVHVNFTLPAPVGHGCFDASTNGLASGNHLLEAICHGIAEVIERDAVALWRRRPDAMAEGTRIDLATVGDPGCRRILKQLEAAELDVAVFEATSDLGVPVFYAVLLDGRRERSHPGIGSGCHLAPEIALLRALTEAVQIRMTYITGVRDDLAADEFTALGRLRKLVPLRALMASSGVGRPFASVASPPVGSTFAEDLDGLLTRLRSAGVDQVVAVDLGKPEYRLPVVKVVIPGLEGPDDHDAYIPGRRARALVANGS